MEDMCCVLKYLFLEVLMVVLQGQNRAEFSVKAGLMEILKPVVIRYNFESVSSDFQWKTPLTV